ncbi:MAG: ATP synthase F1 subunit gamma [Phycisphaerales bacterium]|jgi:F-type H+-transporting ATPase subunit gamma|nr:ATP synthase F1 subunit gamma [Phycisphaerales bacterium]
MGKSREIKKRMKAVANIRRITKTMQMIATAKFSAAQQRATSSKPYAQSIFELVAQLSSAAGEVQHPLMLAPGSSAKPLLLVITSDRGLCGPYNGSILRKMMAFVREDAMVRSGEIELVGKKGAGFLKFNKIEVSRTHVIGDKPRYEDVERLAQEYIDRYSRGEIGPVRVVSMRFISAGKQTPEITQLLPFSAPAKGDAGDKHGATPLYEFSPSAGELIGALLPAAIKSVLFQLFNEAVVSEHVARMIAMKAATDNAGKMGKNLSRQFNRARQAQITTELTEIISGAAALG